MEVDFLSIAGAAALEIANPMRLGFLALGVIFGLTVGVIPGLSGIVGLSLLLPFTFDMDIVTAMAFLLGLSSVVVTSDTIPAVLFGVPGTVGSAATILDGYPMARQGRAAQALGAAFSSSVMGGIFGAALLGLSIPILRPLMLKIATPELLAICIFGLSLVAVLSGVSPLKGLIACCIGVALTSVGDDPQTATLRWTFDTLYLYDGMPIVPVVLGLFALPEMTDLAIMRRNIASDAEASGKWGQLEGIKATFRKLFLVVRCSFIGSLLGAVPGMGASVIDWIAYAHAKRTEKGAEKTFGSGDIRGVISSESSNNAKEGGALIPTIAFGVPGSASMAILLGAFVIHGIIPGPDMLSKHLNVTYSMVWSIAIANILGAGICFLFAGQLAKIARIPIGILAPIVLSFVFVGAFQGSSQWGDIAVLFFFGFVGFIMKRLNWPRPPLMLGFILGGLLERYTFITVKRYGSEWLLRPIVLVLLIIAAIGVFRPLWSNWIGRHRSRTKTTVGFQSQNLDVEVIFTVFVFAVFAAMYILSDGWDAAAKMFPQSTAIIGMLCIAVYLAGKLFTVKRSTGDEGVFDVRDDLGGFSKTFVAVRALFIAMWCGLFVAASNVVGFVVSLFIFTLFYIRFEGKESWKISFAISSSLFVVSYVLFHFALRLVWPHSLIGNLFPGLRSIAWTGIF